MSLSGPLGLISLRAINMSLYHQGGSDHMTPSLYLSIIIINSRILAGKYNTGKAISIIVKEQSCSQLRPRHHPSCNCGDPAEGELLMISRAGHAARRNYYDP